MPAPWLPSWPSGWPDLVAAYKRGIAAIVPAGLVAKSGEASKDWDATAESLSYVRQLLEWIYRRFAPHVDTDDLQTDRWGTDLQVGKRTGGIARRLWIAAHMRQRGTLTADLVRQIMAGAWQSLDPSVVTVWRQGIVAAGTEPTDELQYRENTHVHIYHTAETEAPDYGEAEDLVRRIKPTWAEWTVGRYKIMRYDDDDSGWDRGCWDPSP